MQFCLQTDTPVWILTYIKAFDDVSCGHIVGVRWLSLFRFGPTVFTTTSTTTLCGIHCGGPRALPLHDAITFWLALWHRQWLIISHLLSSTLSYVPRFDAGSRVGTAVHMVCCVAGGDLRHEKRTAVSGCCPERGPGRFSTFLLERGQPMW